MERLSNTLTNRTKWKIGYNQVLSALNIEQFQKNKSHPKVARVPEGPLPQFGGHTITESIVILSKQCDTTKTIYFYQNKQELNS